MLSAKLKIISDWIFEDVIKKLNGNNIPPSLGCIVLKNVESMLQERAIIELSTELLKKEPCAPKQEIKTGTVEDLKNDVKERMKND